MTDQINAGVKVDSANDCKIKGSKIDSNKEYVGEINADVDVKKATSSEVTGSEISLMSSTDSGIEKLRYDFEELLDYLGKNEYTQASEVATPAIKNVLTQKPNLKDRLFSAFKAGGIEALKAVFEHPVVSVSVEAIVAFFESNK